MMVARGMTVGRRVEVPTTNETHGKLEHLPVGQKAERAT
jgi:hypothetical protein